MEDTAYHFGKCTSNS